MTHAPLIADPFCAYISGHRLLVEVDIVVKDSASLRATHDVAEEVQIKFGSLPDVERAMCTLALRLPTNRSIS
ncbi:hypothetical protein Asppvi_009925 [Aspergillus pseudoviridinutans]|uniref:Uncharacterized protein n=1 Tax=Aspergillus pseudoviridinutans TaxID=1517512 RepID=A0A9P3BKF6_9EURO|nr:uncharacterized protein Asppvi_009925 [Aspergillus pseudoviridinutans]GIJ90960.1 hypothetical protein Asppvi_009925 [Aspergillus pseudoviridinutans]